MGRIGQCHVWQDVKIFFYQRSNPAVANYFKVIKIFLDPFLVNLENPLFYLSSYWKWPASCNIFVKWPVDFQQVFTSIWSKQT